MSVTPIVPSWGDSVRLPGGWAISWAIRPTALKFGADFYGYDVDEVPEPMRITIVGLYFGPISLDMARWQPIGRTPDVAPEAT